MAASFMLVIDCADPNRLSRFWVAALGYMIEPPQAGLATWDEYWRGIGVPEEDLGIGEDRIVDPDGRGPGIWFQVVPERKTIKNRLHIDIHASGNEPQTSARHQIPRGPQAARRRLGSQSAGRPGCQPGRRPVRGGTRPLRHRDARPRRQRVRHQLTLAADRRASPAGQPGQPRQRAKKLSRRRRGRAC